MKILRSNNALLPRAVIGALLIFIAVAFLPVDAKSETFRYAAHYTLIALACVAVGINIAMRVFVKFKRGEYLNDELFMTLTAIAAWLITPARVSVFAALLIWQAGELGMKAAERVFNGSFAHLSQLVPETVAVTFGGGSKQIAAEEVVIGDIIQVNPGERVPIDAIVVEGESSMSTFAITGSGTSIPVKPGDRVLAGYTNLTNTLILETRETISRSAVAKLLSWVSDGAGGSSGEQLTRKLAFFLPIAFVAGAITAYALPLIMQWDDLKMQSAAPALLAMAFPASLTRTIPRFYRAGVALATKFGALFRETSSIDALAQVKTMYIEREGTLTTGEFRVVSLDSEHLPEDALLFLAATAYGGTRYSSRYTRALQSAYGRKVNDKIIGRRTEGLDGVIVEIEDVLVACGGRLLMNELKIDTGDNSEDPDIVYVAAGGRYAGRILFASVLREGAAEAVYMLQSADVRTILFTDEDENSAKTTSRALGFDKCYISRTYDNKLKLVSEPLTGYAGTDKRLLDAAAVGVKMSEPGPELLNTPPKALPELTVFNSNPSRIADAHRLSRQIKDATNFNFMITLGIKAAAAMLALLGLLPFWAAIAIESGVKYLCASRKLGS